jgi:hypothetical protein
MVALQFALDVVGHNNAKGGECSLFGSPQIHYELPCAVSEGAIAVANEGLYYLGRHGFSRPKLNFRLTFHACEFHSH